MAKIQLTEQQREAFYQDGYLILRDVIDVDAIKHAGIGVTVPEAQAEALAVADYITSKTGGNGAVRAQRE